MKIYLNLWGYYDTIHCNLISPGGTVLAELTDSDHGIDLHGIMQIVNGIESAYSEIEFTILMENTLSDDLLRLTAMEIRWLDRFGILPDRFKKAVNP